MIKEEKAKQIKKLSQVYFNKKKKLWKLKYAGKENEAERVFFELKWLSDTIKDLKK